MTNLTQKIPENLILVESKLEKIRKELLELLMTAYGSGNMSRDLIDSGKRDWQHLLNEAGKLMELVEAVTK